MTKQEDTRRKSRRDLLLILLLLPFGVLFMFIFGQAAIRLAPTWMLPVNMFSMLNPDANFAGMGNPAYIEPLNSGILTPPSWDKSFLTPGASPSPRDIVATSTPPARIQPPPPEIEPPEENPPPTAIVIGPIVLPTNSAPQQADLAITKTDSSNTYTPGTAIIYSIVVTNRGPDSAPRFNIEDSIPTVITGITVSCTPAVSCGVNRSNGNNIYFTNASLIQGESDQLTITVSGTVNSGATGILSNTADITLPSRPHFFDPNSTNDSVTDTDTQLSIYDVAITKSDPITTYTATDTQFNYTVEVTNSGPSDAIGITINDAIPAGIASWSWTCATANSTCNGVTNSTTSFSDIVTIQSGGSIQYSVTANLVDLSTLTPPQNPWVITNTASIVIPSGPGVIQEQNPANNTATDTNTPVIDLSIQKTNFDIPATYSAGGTVIYQVTATNLSTFALSGITVSDPKPTAITTWDWACASTTNLTNPTCTTVTGLTSDFTATIDLAAGESFQYDVTATIIGNPGDNIVGNLVNTAAISGPTGLVDLNPGDNSSAFTHTSTAPTELNIGSPDSIPYSVPEGTIATFFLSQPIVSNGNNAADFVFYENPMSPGIHLDQIIIEVSSDGSAWSQVFFWGDGIADTNTNVDINLPNIASACTPNSTEEDNCPIASGDLYNNTGITIDLDSLGLSGSYSWIRFTAPAGSGDAAQVDAIQILPQY